MANYLNSIKPFSLFKSERSKPYFVDKSLMIKELLPLIQVGGSYVCITRPRRFGKTLMACMIASYLQKGKDSKTIFQGLKIAEWESAKEYQNLYDVIYITFNEIPKKCETYEQYMNRIEGKLFEDLRAVYPDCIVNEEEAIWDILNRIYEKTESGFVFILDEWDYIFHRDFVSEKDKAAYVEFLSNLLKGQPYVSMAYMTGILPISLHHTPYSTQESKDSFVDTSGESLQAVFPADVSYSSGSELNMFLEYTMATKEKYSEYFGFCDEEVDELYQRYLNIEEIPNISREELRFWYDGYHTLSGRRLYNPRSVVSALNDNQISSYWTSSGPYDEIFYYIEKNVDAVRDDLALMISGIPVSANIQEYAATSMNLSTKDEIFSAMVVYGFLSYENGYVEIPNKELLDKFADTLRKEPSLGYVHRLTVQSEKMLKATKTGDTKTMLEILEYAHDTEIPLLSYSNETDLTAVVNLVYLAARDAYRVEREDKAGIGYVDFIFYPIIDRNADCIILELKVDSTPEEAIRQIKEKKYALRFVPKAGEPVIYSGRILAVGIAYDKRSKKHDCRVEVL